MSSTSPKAICLVSGGLDSCVALAWTARNLTHDILPLSFAYGQRHSREVAAASKICEHYNLPEPRYINLSQAFYMIGGSSLTSGTREGNPSQESVDRTHDLLPPTFVPGRNMIFLSIAAAIGYTDQRYDIVGGWNAVDYSGYPDCRQAFLLSMQSVANHALGLPRTGTPAFEQITIHHPLLTLTKAEIIQLGHGLLAPLHLTWSCYSGDTEPCGECDSCKIRAQGFKDLGLADPALAVT